MTYLPTFTTPNGRLRLRIRADGLKLAGFQMELDNVCQQLIPLDQVNSHDEILSDDLLAQVGEWRIDPCRTALSLACVDYRNAVCEMKKAHAHVAGLFKGQLRDASEEMLARSIKAAEDRLAQLEALSDEYEVPKRPYEIRRNALSALIEEVDPVVNNIISIVEVFEEADLDLLEQLLEIASQVKQIKTKLEKMRERASQKMAENLEECRAMLTEIWERYRELEAEVGRRSPIIPIAAPPAYEAQPVLT